MLTPALPLPLPVEANDDELLLLAVLVVDELLLVEPVEVLLPEKLLLALKLPVGELLTNEVLFIKPCSISAKFLALACCRRNTRSPPSLSAGTTSNSLTSFLIFSRLRASPLTSSRLLRLSAMTRTREPRTSLLGETELIASTKVMISSAWLCLSGIMSSLS